MTQVETMKLALEELEGCYVTFYEDEDIAEAITALRQAIEQAQKQEPVAWALWWEDNPDYFVDDYISTYKEVVEDEFLPTVVGNPKVIPLYTSPPQRQPLTDEEIDDIWGGSTIPILRQEYINLVRAIEAAHGIKENT